MHEQQPKNASQAVGRIGYVVKRYPRFSETFIVNEVIAHEAAGVDIEIFALRPSVDTHFQNIISQVRAPVTYLPSGSVKAGTLWRTCHKLTTKFPGLWAALSEAESATAIEAWQAIELAKEIRERKIDHLHAHFATSAATVARLAACIAGITYSVTMHAKDIFHESVVQEDLQRKITDARFVITVSDFNHQYLSSRYGHGSKIHRIYNGLDLELFDYRPKTSHSRRIISVGRLVPKKGLRHLIDACKILADRNVDFECDIVGNGELKTDLGNQIRDLSLEPFVNMVGPQPQNVVREMIRSAAVFAAPCVVGDDGNRDGLPTVITESLALGTPCIATDVTGIPEIVRHGETGVIIEQENSDELANEIQKILDDERQRKILSENGRRLVECEFDVHKNVEQIRALFPPLKQKIKSPHISRYQRA